MIKLTQKENDLELEFESALSFLGLYLV